MIDMDQFLSDFGNKPIEKEVDLATIDTLHTNGRPKVIYDKDVLTGTLSKPLPYLSSYTPTANDRVLIVKGVVVGKIM